MAHEDLQVHVLELVENMAIDASFAKMHKMREVRHMQRIGLHADLHYGTECETEIERARGRDRNRNAGCSNITERVDKK